MLRSQQFYDFRGLFYSTAVVSEADGMTPMNVQSLELDAGIAGAGHVGGEVGPTSEQKCQDCASLNTEVLAKGTDFLSAKATVVGTAGAAAAGILWLTVLAG